MSLLETLLSKVIVNAAPKVLPSAIGAGISSGVGNVAGSALASALAPGSSSPAPTAPQAQPAPTGDAGTIEGVDVVANTGPVGAAPPSALSSAIGAIADGMGDMGGGDGGGEIDIPAMQRQLANINGSNTLTGDPAGDGLVEGVDVTAARPQVEAAGLPNTFGMVTTDAINAELQDNLAMSEEDQAAQKKQELLEKFGPLGLLGLLPLKDLIGAGLLGAGLLANKDTKTTDPNGPAGPLTQLANNNAATAKALTAGGMANLNGNIGGQALGYIARQVRQAQAAIRQRYAGMGMSGSTAEQQDLNAATEAGVDMQFKIGQQMATTGLNAAAALSGQSATIYAALLNQQTQRDTQLGNALASFAAAVVK